MLHERWLFLLPCLFSIGTELTGSSRRAQLNGEPTEGGAARLCVGTRVALAQDTGSGRECGRPDWPVRHPSCLEQGKPPWLAVVHAGTWQSPLLPSTPAGSCGEDSITALRDLPYPPSLAGEGGADPTGTWAFPAPGWELLSTIRAAPEPLLAAGRCQSPASQEPALPHQTISKSCCFLARKCCHPATAKLLPLTSYSFLPSASSSSQVYSQHGSQDAVTSQQRGRAVGSFAAWDAHIRCWLNPSYSASRPASC